jgi:hypothetical protein
VSHVERPFHHHFLHRPCELQQPQQVGGGGARAADGVSRLLVRHLEFVDQALNPSRFLHRIQVFALNVLDQRKGQRCLVGHVAHQHRDLLESRHLCGAPPALPRDELVALAVDRPDEQGLHQPLRANRRRKLGQRLLVHLGPRLVFARANASDRKRRQRVPRRSGVRPEERVQTPA